MQKPAIPQALRLVLTWLAVLPLALVHAAPSTLQLEIGGRTTGVDVYPPAAAAAATRPDVVVLAHGFTRSRATMAGHAASLARDGRLVVVPDLPYVLDSRDNAVALRDLVAQLRDGAAGPPLGRVVLVGFSAGGLSALLATDARGVVGYVGLDPFDRPGGVGLEVARRLGARLADVHRLLVCQQDLQELASFVGSHGSPRSYSR